jgi:hypothetical protein
MVAKNCMHLDKGEAHERRPGEGQSSLAQLPES